jgi:hypothetical protein
MNKLGLNYVEIRAQPIPKPNSFGNEYDVSTFLNGKLQYNLGRYDLSGDKLTLTERIDKTQNFPFLPKLWVDKWSY